MVAAGFWYLRVKFKFVDREAPASSRARHRGATSKSEDGGDREESVRVRSTRGTMGPLAGIHRRRAAGGL
jgi:hypothetical protein